MKLLWRQLTNNHHYLWNRHRPPYMQLYESMKQCSSKPIARKLHAQFISSGLFYFSVFLHNHLLNMYFNCHLIHDASRVFFHMPFRNVFASNTMISGFANAGRLDNAKKVFDKMPHRDSVSWNSMMSAYFRNGKYEEVLKVFVFMIRDHTCLLNFLSFSCAMKACGALGHFNLALQLHGLIEKFDFACDDTSIETSVMDMYIKCGAVNCAERVFLRIQSPSLFCFNSMLYGYSNSYGVTRALDLFNQLPERDSVSWSTMISILCQHGFGVLALGLFVEMWTQGFRPNSLTFACVLSACTSICDLEWGIHLHARIVRMEPIIDVCVGNSLVDMYAKCGCLEFARRVFNSLTEHNAVSWTSLISGVAQHGFKEEAMLLFNQMRDIPLALDEFVVAIVLKICSHLDSSSSGRQLHAFATKSGLGSFVLVGNALITMYSKFGDTENANLAFEMMPIRNIISWTSMITAFSQAGDVEKAQACFNEMPRQNVVTWNSMISMYIQHGFWECGLKLYVEMQRECIVSDDITLATSISACADLAMLELGIQIAAQAEKLGFGFDVSVANSIVTMYSRCGQIKEARKAFDLISMKNLVTWNSMISGYSQNGHGKIAIEIFKNMLKMEVTPDHISYVSVLSGCSYAGLVTEGKYYFESMSKEFGISPTHEHFTCMVDLLGRAGLLDQAKSLIDEMPFTPNADVWGALLGACKMHGNPKLAEFAVRNLLEMDVDNSGSHILLAHIYSGCGKLEGIADIRKLMKEKGIQKNPGYSWIGVNNQVHVFTADETSHPQVKEICVMLDVIFSTLLFNNQTDEGRMEELTSLELEHEKLVN